MTISANGGVSFDAKAYAKACDIDSSKCINAFKNLAKAYRRKF